MNNTTPMQELLHYIQNSNALTFLPEQLSSVIEQKYLPLEKSTITNAFDAGESNIWNSKRDEGFDFEGGADYYKQTFTNNND
jgi:hypothetical protein